MYIYIIYTSIYIYLYNKSVRAAGCNVWFDPPQKQTHPCMSDRHVDYIYIYIYIYIYYNNIHPANQCCYSFIFSNYISHFFDLF